MFGSREIHGADVLAAMKRFGAGDVDLDVARELIGPGDVFDSFEQLVRACPPEKIGLVPGRFAWLLEPLFGEFE